MQVSKDKVVSIDYTLRNDEGHVLDSSEGRQPLSYIQGKNNIIPGLENALEGKSAGDNVQAKIPPDQAYGAKDQNLVQQVPRTMFPPDADIKVGQQFQARSQNGMHVVTVVGTGPDNVTIDANHPLAGQTLNFDVTVREVRDATAEELSHGHVHGPEGHHH